MANAEHFLRAEGKTHLFPSHGVVSPELVSLLEVDSQRIWGQGLDESYSGIASGDVGAAHVTEIKKVAKALGGDVAKYSFIASLGEFF